MGRPTEGAPLSQSCHTAATEGHTCREKENMFLQCKPFGKTTAETCMPGGTIFNVITSGACAEAWASAYNLTSNKQILREVAAANTQLQGFCSLHTTEVRRAARM
jgi:hypothetical protein